MRVIRQLLLITFLTVAFCGTLNAGISAVQKPRSLGRIYARRHTVATGAIQPSVKLRRQITQPRMKGISLPTNSGFLAPNQTVLPGYAVASVGGDFDGNGTTDVASIILDDTEATQLCILLSAGGGSFNAPQVTPITFDSSWDVLYAADLNKDGKDDLIIVHGGSSSGSVDILLNNGNGTFAPAVTYADNIGTVMGVTVADLSHTGYPDIFLAEGTVVDSPVSPHVQQIQNNGNSTFSVLPSMPVPGIFSSAVFADVNGDGKLDLVTNTQVFLAGSGTYSAVDLPNAVSGPAQDGTIAVADLNRDGKPDIVIVNGDKNSVKIYLNTGAGAFQEGTSYWAGFSPEFVTIADVNGDMIPDIIVGNAASGDVTVLLGKGISGVGNGTFEPITKGFAAGGLSWTTKPLLADFSGDRQMDVLMAVSIPNSHTSLTLLQGFGDGTFRGGNNYYAQPPAVGEPAAYGVGLAAADLDGNGTTDFVLGNAAGSGITVFLANGDGTLNPGVNYGSGGDTQFVGTGDFNHDGKQDVIASAMWSGDAYLFLGNGDGTLQSPTLINVSGGAAPGLGLVVGDFNNDGWPDFAMVAGPSSLYVQINNHQGFNAPLSYPLSSLGWEISAGDLDGDGRLDLVVATDSYVAVLKGNGDGTFRALADVNLGAMYPGNVAIGDLNADGRPDLAVGVEDPYGSMGIVTLIGNGDGSFQAPVFLASSTSSSATSDSYPGQIRAADLNRDGKLDLVYTNGGYSTVGVMYGKGDGTFLTPVEFPVGGWPYAVMIADLNGDGASDAVIGNDNYSGVTTLFNVGGAAVTVASSLNPATDADMVTFTATVAGTRGTGTPTGTVTFKDGSSVLQTVALVAGQGSWMLATPLSAGTHAISVIYSGDSSFLSGSGTMIEAVNQSASASYTLAAAPPSATIRPGHSTTFTITATPTGNISPTDITFSCGTLPAELVCQFAPAVITISGTQAGSTSLVVTASSTILSQVNPAGRYPFTSLPLWASFAGMLFGAVVLEGSEKKNRRAIIIVILVVTVLASTVFLTGCAASGTSGNSHSSPVSKTVRIIATGPQGQRMQTLNLTVLLQR